MDGILIISSSPSSSVPTSVLSSSSCHYPSSLDDVCNIKLISSSSSLPSFNSYFGSTNTKKEEEDIDEQCHHHHDQEEEDDEEENEEEEEEENDIISTSDDDDDDCSNNTITKKKTRGRNKKKDSKKKKKKKISNGAARWKKEKQRRQQLKKKYEQQQQQTNNDNYKKDFTTTATTNASTFVVIYSCNDKEISKRGNRLCNDEILHLGSYEVIIVSKRTRTREEEKDEDQQQQKTGEQQITCHSKQPPKSSTSILQTTKTTFPPISSSCSKRRRYNKYGERTMTTTSNDNNNSATQKTTQQQHQQKNNANNNNKFTLLRPTATTSSSGKVIAQESVLLGTRQKEKQHAAKEEEENVGTKIDQEKNYHNHVTSPPKPPLTASAGGGGVLVSVLPNKKRKILPVVLRSSTNRSNVIGSTSTLEKTNKITTTSTIQRVEKKNIVDQHDVVSSGKSNSTTTTVATTSVLPNIPLPASIRNALKPHQVSGVQFLWNALLMKNHQQKQEQQPQQQVGREVEGFGGCNAVFGGCGAILADEMGLGKTLMTIAVIVALHRKRRDKQFVVVCPSSLVMNWSKEFDKWIGRASQPKRVVINKGGQDGIGQIRAYCNAIKQTTAAKKMIIGQVLIISYDLFRMNVQQFHQVVDSNNDPNMTSSSNINTSNHSSATTTIGLLVVDEGHRLKNQNGSQTLDALMSLTCDARLCLTATPIQNNLSEFYTIANFVRPGIFGNSIREFRTQYEKPISDSNNCTSTQQQRILGKQRSIELDNISKTFILRRLQKDILKTMLPKRYEFLIFCKPTKEQCILYKSITNNHHYHNHNHRQNTADALSTLISLRKICSHPRLYDGDARAVTTTAKADNHHYDYDDFDYYEENHPPNVEDNYTLAEYDDVVAKSGKLIILDSLLRSIRKNAPSDKVVIVSNFTSALSMIETYVLNRYNNNIKSQQQDFDNDDNSNKGNVAENKITMPYVRLDGTTDTLKRQELVDIFNRSSTKHSFIFLLSSKAGGCGINLIGSNRLIMYDPDWNPASDIQAMGRIYRQGQNKCCYIYRLFTTGTIEEIICQRQIQKNRLVKLTVDNNNINRSCGGRGGHSSRTNRNSNAARSSSFSKEELVDCFMLKDDVPDCDTRQKIIAHARTNKNSNKSNQWPPYNGPQTIRSAMMADHDNNTKTTKSCGEEDEEEPLIQVAENHADILSHIHIVDDDHDDHVDAAGDDDHDIAWVTKNIASHDKEQDMGCSDDDDDDEEFEFI